ncbi:MAG: class I SAM-dependent methyltransferase [Oryzomonas sp.]|jgi:methyltransferase (TIGR00027 family)
MKENCPSDTALRVAFRRAAHQILDDPKVFDDPLALRILGVEKVTALEQRPEWLEETALSRVLRASLAARSRYAEDELQNAVVRGVQQYIVLGAGLDTFAYRNPYPDGVLNVFEVDHPATQNWKRARFEESGISVPKTLTFTPMDFESQTLAECLLQVGFDPRKGTFISWLGVTAYLTDSAITATLQFVLSLRAGSGVVFDYLILPSLLSPTERQVFNSLADRVALAGEPFKSFFDPSTLKSTLKAMGFRQIKDIEPEEMNTRYFQGRSDKLRVGRLAHIMNARI